MLLFSIVILGYIMVFGFVYSSFIRLLFRNILLRSVFKFKKFLKYCSWKCIVLCVVGVLVFLVIFLFYFIGKNKFLELFCL